VALIAYVLANIAAIAAIALSGIDIGRLAGLGPRQLFVLTVAQDLTLGACLLLLMRVWPRLGLADVGLRVPPHPRLALGVGAALWGLSIAIANAQALALGAHPQTLVVAVSAHRGLEAFVLDMVSGAVIVPFVEELFFRAVIFTLLRQRMRLAYAAGISSAIFTVGHDVGSWIPVFVLGLGLAILYDRRHSLWTNALAHGVVNAISFALLFVIPDSVF
jgi:membrane protease YdiL (CAAX protease family)